MYMKEDVIRFLTELKIKTDEFDGIVNNGIKKNTSNPDAEIQSLIASLDDVKGAIFNANAIINSVLIKYSENDLSALVGIEDEINKLTCFEGLIYKMKGPLVAIFNN